MTQAPLFSQHRPHCSVLILNHVYTTIHPAVSLTVPVKRQRFRSLSAIMPGKKQDQYLGRWKTPDPVILDTPYLVSRRRRWRVLEDILATNDQGSSLGRSSTLSYILQGIYCRL